MKAKHWTLNAEHFEINCFNKWQTLCFNCNLNGRFQSMVDSNVLNHSSCNGICYIHKLRFLSFAAVVLCVYLLKWFTISICLQQSNRRSNKTIELTKLLWKCQRKWDQNFNIIYYFNWLFIYLRSNGLLPFNFANRARTHHTYISLCYLFICCDNSFWLCYILYLISSVCFKHSYCWMTGWLIGCRASPPG